MPETRPVLLTGISGFVAKRIALDLLQAGHAVRGSLRSMAKADEVRGALRPALADAAALDRLSFVELDLTRDAGWPDAMEGTQALIHTASPFPLKQPKDEDAVIRPAVDGTLRALGAAEAAGVSRVVLTSSMEAVMHGHESATLTEADWSDPAAKTATAYTRSKLMAERAAWDFAAKHPGIGLTTIMPGVVLGRPLDRHYGSSIRIVQRILAGRDPMQPDLSFPVVDVADVAAMHVAALARPQAAGRRYIAGAGYLSFPDMARNLKAAYPDRRIATRVAPDWIIGLMALFDGELRPVRHWLGKRNTLSHQAAVADLGIRFTPAMEAALASAAFLAEEEAEAGPSG